MKTNFDLKFGQELICSYKSLKIGQIHKYDYT